MRHDGTLMRADIALARGSRTDRLLTIVERDNVWYVDDEGHKGKYRPYEAALIQPTMYSLLERAKVRCLTPDVIAGYSGPLGESQGRVVLRAPLPAQKQANLARAIGFLESFPDDKLDEVAYQGLSRLVEQLKASQSATLELEVDVASGILARIETERLPVEISGFKWGPSDDAAWAQPDDARYTDYTAPLITDASTQDVVLFCQQKGWKVGEPVTEADVTILNFKTGASRRVPFPLGAGLPGCFSRDRHKVYLAGSDSIEGTLGLYEIDLDTAKSKPLAQELWNAGCSLLPCDVSPDGRTLAALRVWPMVGAVTTVVLIDLQTGKHRTLGDPIDTPVATWFPDGESLLIVDRHYQPDPKTPPQPMVCRLSLDGDRTTILPGKAAWILGDQARILLDNGRPHHHWQTCDLHGADPKPLGDGLVGFETPSPSPDGKKILMMKLPPNAGQPPLPYLIDSITGRAARLRTGPGRWTRPRW